MTTMAELNVNTSEDFLDEDSPLGGRVIVVASSPKSTMSFESAEDKAQEIRECLLLHNESCSGIVDLWELRQLAISPGGLLSPALRQVAWPLLAGLDLFRLEEADSTTTTVDENLAECLQRDIETSVWHLEELVRQSQAGKDGFWYAPLLRSANGSLETDAPGMVLSSPCSSSDATSQDGSLATAHSPRIVKHGPSSQDQILLTKVLTKALQGQSEYPVGGLANLAALFMVNLESTALASLLLSQLATYPLKAAFSGATMESLDKVLNVLLETFQPKSSLKVEEAMAWFTGIQTANLQAASRLMDAFLVGHPLFPLYFGAASVDTPAPWTVENVEVLITTALGYMEQMPPCLLIKAANAHSILPTTPVWASAATVSADWAPSRNGSTLGQPSTSPDNCQHDGPFSDEESSSEWERLSTVSKGEAHEMAQDDNTTQSLITTKEALFHDSYPLAMTAAGLSHPSTSKSRSIELPSTPQQSSSAGSQRYLKKYAFLITAIVAVLVGVLSQPFSSHPPASINKALPRPTVQRLLAPTGSVPRERPHDERFLGLVPVARPAPKSVLRSMGSTSQPQTMVHQMEVAAKPMKMLKPVGQKYLGLVPVERPAPKKVLRMVSSMSVKPVKAPNTVPPVVEGPVAPPKAAPSTPPPRRMETTKQQPALVPSTPQAKWSLMIHKEEAANKPSASDDAPESELRLQKYLGFQGVLGWTSEPNAAAAPDRKFKPLGAIKKQLKKAGQVWSKLLTFFRRRLGEKKKTA